MLLARSDLDADRFDAAAASYRKAIAASPKVAADPDVWCEYADALGMTQGGSLAGEPRELVMRALTLEPDAPKALEMAGSAAWNKRDFAAAAAYWRQLLAQLARRARARSASSPPRSPAPSATPRRCAPDPEAFR